MNQREKIDPSACMPFFLYFSVGHVNLLFQNFALWNMHNKDYVHIILWKDKGKNSFENIKIWCHLMTCIEKRTFPRLGRLLDHNIIQSIQKEVGVQVNLLTYQSLASTVWTKTLGILVVLLFSLGQTHLHLTSSYWPCNNMSNVNYVDLDDTKLVNK